jgi:predicted amidohydrolase YtcJ
MTRHSTAAAALLLTASALLSAQMPRLNVPDAIYYNGKIVTVDGRSQVAQAFAVHGERFLAVGRSAEIRSLAGHDTQIVDLHGRTVVPGLIDNHNHQYHVAVLSFRGVDVKGAATLAEMLDRVRRASAAAKPGETIFTTTGWSPEAFPEKRGPTREELDAIASDRPIVVYASRSRVHVNSAALKAVGMSSDTPLVAGVTSGRGPAGALDGVLTGSPASVLNLTARIVPTPTLDEQKGALLKIQAEQHQMGLTGIRDLQIHPDVMRAYFELWREHALTLRTSVGLELNAGEEDKLERMLESWGVGPGFGDEWLRLDCVAEYNPGEQVREPYIDRGSQDVGELRLPVGRFRQAILTMNRYGWRPAIHITGDKTLDIVLDAYEAADHVRSIKDRRWVVEHIPLVHPDQMVRMKHLGVVVSAQFQPYAGAEGMLKRLGPERTEHAVPMREMLDAGLVVSGGSDWPGAPNNPFVNIYYYTTRKTLRAGPIGAAQKISRLEALRVMTVNNAYLTFEERIKGSIETGKLADFVVLSDDLLTVPDERLLSITPLATYVGGRRVYAAPASSARN